MHVSFNLELIPGLEEPSREHPRSVAQERPILKHGSSYFVRAQASIAPASETHSFLVDSGISISLFVVCGTEAVYRAISIIPPRIFIDTETLLSSSFEFLLTVAEECPTAEVTLDLLAAGGGGSGTNSVANLNGKLEGTYEPSQAEVFAACNVNLTSPLPDDTAILYVQEPSPDHLALTGFDRKKVALRTSPLRGVPMRLGSYVAQGTSPTAIRNSMRRFSRHCPPELLNWLDSLCRHHGDRFCLIVADHTDSQVSWEMLELDDGRYLGTLGMLVRWIPVSHYGNPHQLRMEQLNSDGRIIAYLDHTEATHAKRELNALATFETNYCASVKDLIKELSEPLDAVGLVYLGCHGMIACGAEHRLELEGLVALGSLSNPSERLLDLEVEEVRMHDNPRPVVFANACHSAHIHLGSLGFNGWAEVSLARFASGYLGTVGPVGSEFAASVAERILASARQLTSNLPVARILRELRVEALQDLELNQGDRDLEKFLFAFMYVFFGSPRASLRLNPAQ